MNDLIRMLNLGGFSDIEKKIMEDNKVDFNKAIGNLLKSSRKSLNLHKCYYCKNDISGFCNSHSVPAFCLRNIAESGEVAYSNALIDFPLLKGKKGVNQAGTFNLICRDCDKKVFADYENPDNYVNYPTPKMIAQIALKDNLKFISRRLLEKEMYEYMCQNYNLPEKIKNEKQYVIDLDLKEYVNGFNKAKKAVIKNWDNEYYICYYKKLNYVVPLAFQSSISLTIGFNGDVINDVYNPSPKYSIKPIHICIFPLKTESIIMMFVDDGDKRYRKFYKQFNKLSLDKQLSTLTYILFAYSEDVFFSKHISEEMKKCSELVAASQVTQDILSLTPNFNPLEEARLNLDLSNSTDIPNLLSEQYQLS